MTDHRHVTLIDSGIFLILGIQVQRKIIDGSPAQLRKEILRTTFKPLLILGLHVAWPIVAAVHATVFLGTYLKPEGAARKLIMFLFGAIALSVNIALTFTFIVAAIWVFNRFF